MQESGFGGSTGWRRVEAGPEHDEAIAEMERRKSRARTQRGKDKWQFLIDFERQIVAKQQQ